MRAKKEESSSPKLKRLENCLAKVEKAERYLDIERTKLVRERKKICGKIRKEKEVLRLKKQIEIVKNRKD